MPVAIHTDTFSSSTLATGMKGKSAQLEPEALVAGSRAAEAIDPTRTDRLLAEIASVLERPESPEPLQRAGSSRVATLVRYPARSQSPVGREHITSRPRGRFVELVDALSTPVDLDAISGSSAASVRSTIRPALSRMPSHTTLQTVDEGDGMEVAADAVDDGFMRSTRPGSVLEERAYRTVSPTPPATRPFFARATSFPLQAPRDRRTPTPLRDLSTPSSERDNYYEGELQREVARLRAELATMRSKARDSVASSDHQHALAQQKERAKTTVEAFREELAIAHDQLRVAQQEINRLSTAQAEAEEAARRARDTARRAVDMVYQAKAQVEGVNLGALEARREWSVVKRDEAEERVESDEVEIEEDETESWTLPGIPSEPDSARNSAHYPAIAGPARSARRPPPPTSMIRRHSDSDARTIRLESAVTRLSAKLQRVRQQRDILADRLRQIRDSEHSAASRRFSVNSDASRQSALPSEMSRRTAARIEMLFPNVDDEPTSCIWHALHPETILPNLGPTPDGMLDCGCTVDEGLFEEALTRNGVGHFMVEEDMISGDVIESGLRGALLELLQRRFDYLDGLLEIDPHTGDWENGEGHDTWEEGLQELSASSQAAQSMDARSISAFSYTTASQY